MIQVGIRDFQIIERLSLPLEGIVAITGPSNNGKTSVARAIEACLYNWTGDHFINDKGADQCLVGISFSESKYRPAVQVVWEKPRSGGARYTLNNEEYNKAGRSVLPELMSEGFAILETPRAKFPLQFWKQMEIFLVNESPSTVFDVLSRLLEDRQLLPVLKSLKDMISSGQKEAQRQEGQCQLLTETQASLEKEIQHYVAFSAFEPKILRVKYLRESLQTLTALQNQRLETVQNQQTKEKEIMQIMTPFSFVSRSVEQALKSYRLLERSERLMALKTSVTEILMSKQKLQSKLSVFDQIEKLDPQRLLTFEEQSIRLLKARSLLRTISSEQNQCNQLTDIANRVEEFENRLSRITALTDKLNRLEDLRNQITTIQELQEKTDQEQSEIESSFQEFKTEAGVCPECGGLGFTGGEHVHD